MPARDVFVDTLTFTLATGQEESRRDGIETIAAIRELTRRRPDVQTVLGLSNISFGLAPPARVVLNSVFLDECREAGLSAAIVHASKILPVSRIPEEQYEAALDLVHDRRREGHDPLTHFLGVMEGSDAGAGGQSRAEELAALPLDERLHRRVVDGERNGLEADLDTAMSEGQAPLEIGQHDAARRDEGGRGALRRGEDAAAVRAPGRRGHEGRRRAPRAAHGARRQPRQGLGPARDGQGRRPTTSARTSSTSS